MMNKSPLWTGKQVVHLTQGKGSDQWKADGVSIDTRTLKPGDLFIALKGARHDSHHFLHEAAQKGARAALVQDLPAHSPAMPLVHVPDSFQALKALSEQARDRFQGQILALTGSVGKTTIKEGLFHVLKNQAKTHASLGSLNNHIGVPLSLARLDPTEDYSIFEVGMNHAKEIETLTQLIKPHVGMVTNVSYQHGVHFSGIEEIVQAKSEIFTHVQGKKAIIPYDSPHYQALLTYGTQQGMEEWITFGRHPNAFLSLKKVEKKDNGQLRITCHLQGQRDLTYGLADLGEHWIDNSLAILAGVYALGACLEKAGQALEDFHPVVGRGQRLKIGGITVIDESYNAAPAAMEAVLKAFAHAPKTGRKYLLLGEMRELGDQTAFYHQALYDQLLSIQADGIWLCGPAMAELGRRLPNVKDYKATIEALVPSVLETLTEGDTLLVKGARGTRTFLIIDQLYRHYGQEEKALAYPLRTYLNL